MLNPPISARVGGFSPEERRLLLSLPRIGERVIERIEALGVASLQELHHRGIDRVVDSICREQGNLAWRNRRRALVSALSAVAPQNP